MFQNGVLPHHAQVAHTVLHIGDDVGGLGQHGVQRVVRKTVDEPPPGIFHGGTVQPHPFQQFHSLILKPALGEGHPKPGSGRLYRGFP